MSKELYFYFIRPEDISPKSTIFVPMCSCKPYSGFFYGSFGAVASSLLRGLSGYVDIGLVLLWIYIYFCTRFLQLLHKVLWGCAGIDLHFWHQSTFISRRQNASPSWVVWQLRGPMVFIVAYYCLYRWMWYLQAFGNCSQGWTRLVEVYNCSSEVLADFFWFSHDVKQRGTEFEGRPWNTSTGTPPINSNDVIQPIRSF